jgi:hypothetical protein
MLNKHDRTLAKGGNQPATIYLGEMIMKTHALRTLTTHQKGETMTSLFRAQRRLLLRFIAGAQNLLPMLVGSAANFHALVNALPPFYKNIVGVNPRRMTNP